MDINELLEDKDNGRVPLDGRSYYYDDAIAAYAGQLRQAWRYYYRTHKVDLAILYQLTGLRDRLDPDKDPEQYAHAVKAVEAINGVLAQNRIIQTRISALMTDCRKKYEKNRTPHHEQ